MAIPPARDSIKDELCQQFVGKSLLEVPTPSHVLDLSKLKRNCTRMLEATEALQIGWRAHIKTHKTTELTRLQVGEGPRPAQIIVSTLKEAECVLPLLQEYKAANRAVNILWGFPIPPSSAPRLAALATALGPGGLSLLVDHIGQLPTITQVHTLSGVSPNVYVKIDMGGKRAGIDPSSTSFPPLITALLSLQSSGTCILSGLYSHAGHSYYNSTPAAAIDFLRQEFDALLASAIAVTTLSPRTTLVLSVGATPTTTSIRNLFAPETVLGTDELSAIAALKGTITAIRNIGCGVEIHAGVYPVLDIQQLATHALAPSLLSWDDVAGTVLAEVASLYPGRGLNGGPEVLIGAGSLALGREPCKAYGGWGIVSPWNIAGTSLPDVGPEQHAGWQVGRISQEHGVLVWSGKEDQVVAVEIGQRVRIWPNHACIAGAGHDWYLVVDGEGEGKGEIVVDVWPRWRGW